MNRYRRTKGIFVYGGVPIVVPHNFSFEVVFSSTLEALDHGSSMTIVSRFLGESIEKFMDHTPKFVKITSP